MEKSHSPLIGVSNKLSDLNQLVIILSRPNGTQESGKYWLIGGSYTNGAYLGSYTGSISRGSVPASGVAIGTTDQSPSNCNAPTADNLTANGFRVYTTSTGTATLAQCAGAYVISY